ncbi:PKD-like family lipoprotein [Niastella sp. OAS944]|uniref:PKD-like family lipoprotein n=1 Tax=Niastella sp. OAS944 TaxID=2664089 RepID=UPI003491226D|nr:hypothetical protein [Chitinophagaceae bacterium OAS944]
MTKYNTYFFILFITAVILAGCYKDKGNYDYRDINQVVLNTDSDTVIVILPAPLKVNLSLQQTIPGNQGFSFEWVLYPTGGVPATRRTIGITQNLEAVITELPGTYYLMLYAKDRSTGVEYQKRLYISVLTAYSEGWLVVEENNGQCDLSMITPADTIFRNIYSQANEGAKLPAGTRRIPEIKTNRGEQKIFILSPADMVQANYSDLVKISGFSGFFWQAPAVPKPQEYFVNGDDEVMLNNGLPYGRTLVSSGTNKLNLPPDGKYYMAPFEIYSSSIGYLLYDNISQSFFRLDLNTMNLVPFTTPTTSQSFYLNSIGKRLLYAGINTTTQYNAIFKNNNNDSLFAYVFNPTSASPAINRYDGLSAPGLLNAHLFVGSRKLPHLYYAFNNSIYKLDIQAKTATVIYSFSAGTEITAMKMYRNMKTSADVNNNNLIAIATYENGEGKVYYFPLAATGNFINNTYSKLFTGFNWINELTFKSLK